MSLPAIPEIPAKLGEAGAYQERLYEILTAMKAHIDDVETRLTAVETPSEPTS